jgi:hypothetical protein
MRFDHKSKTPSPFMGLSPLQKACCIVAVGAAFIDTFAWFVKIIFF